MSEVDLLESQVLLAMVAEYSKQTLTNIKTINVFSETQTIYATIKFHSLDTGTILKKLIRNISKQLNVIQTKDQFICRNHI